MPQRSISEIIQGRDYLTTLSATSIRSVAAQMKAKGAGAVMVVDESHGRLIGICTERDLAFKVLAEGLNAESTTIDQVMTARPQTIRPDRPFGHALHLMFEGGFRHLPVVDAAGRPVGIVSARDALGLEVIHFRNEIEQRESLAECL